MATALFSEREIYRGNQTPCCTPLPPSSLLPFTLQISPSPLSTTLLFYFRPFLLRISEIVSVIRGKVCELVGSDAILVNKGFVRKRRLNECTSSFFQGRIAKV